MSKPITAISVHSRAKDELIEKLDGNNVPIRDIIDRFDRTVFIFRRATYVVSAKIHCLTIDGSDFQVVEPDVLKEIKLGAAPKKEMYRPREASAARARFDRLHRKHKTILVTMRRGAHKGWVTKSEYAWRADQGLFTHVYRIEFNFHGNRHVEEGNCVCLEQAQRALYRKAKLIEKKFIGAEIISKSALPIKTKKKATA